jgi:transcriptional regulator with XRE-family HTH domain
MQPKILTLIRKFHRMSQTQLAQNLGLCQVQVSKYETGRTPISLEVLRKYSEYFKIPMSNLFLFQEISENPSLGEKWKKLCAKTVINILEFILENENE